MAARRLFRCRPTLFTARTLRPLWFPFNAFAARLHQNDDVVAGWLFGPLDLFALLLLADEILERIFVLVLKFLWIKCTLFRLDDVDGKVEHILGNFFVLNILAVFFLVAHLVRVSERDAHQSFVASLKRN